MWVKESFNKYLKKIKVLRDFKPSDLHTFSNPIAEKYFLKQIDIRKYLLSKCYKYFHCWTLLGIRCKNMKIMEKINTLIDDK